MESFFPETFRTDVASEYHRFIQAYDSEKTPFEFGLDMINSNRQGIVDM